MPTAVSSRFGSSAVFSPCEHPRHPRPRLAPAPPGCAPAPPTARTSAARAQLHPVRLARRRAPSPASPGRRPAASPPSGGSAPGPRPPSAGSPCSPSRPTSSSSTASSSSSAEARREVQEVRHRRLPRAHQRPRVRQQRDALRRRQRPPGSPPAASSAGVVVGHPVEARGARRWRTATSPRPCPPASPSPARLAQEHPLLAARRSRPRSAAPPAPATSRRCSPPAPSRSAAGTASPCGPSSFTDTSGKPLWPIHALASSTTGCFDASRQRAPQVIRHRVRARVLAHVLPDALAEGVLAQEALNHPQHRAALLVGDGVEALAGLARRCAPRRGWGAWT